MADVLEESLFLPIDSMELEMAKVKKQLEDKIGGECSKITTRIDDDVDESKSAKYYNDL